MPASTNSFVKSSSPLAAPLVESQRFPCLVAANASALQSVLNRDSRLTISGAQTSAGHGTDDVNKRPGGGRGDDDATLRRRFRARELCGDRHYCS